MLNVKAVRVTARELNTDEREPQCTTLQLADRQTDRQTDDMMMMPIADQTV